MARRPRQGERGPLGLPGPVPQIVGALGEVVLAEFDDPARGVHAETALAAPATAAGTTVLRQALGGALDDLTPGSTVLADAMDAEEASALQFLAWAAPAFGSTWTWDGEPPPAGREPLQPPAELVRRVEPGFVEVLDGFVVEPADRSRFLLLAALDLARRAGGVVEPPIACAVIGWSFVAGTKTVPHPI